MPHFSDAGNDMYICQVCARQLDSVLNPPEWRPDITGNQRAGNVCPGCAKGYNPPLAFNALLDKEHSRDNSHLPPVSLYEHCKQESGLTDPPRP